MHAHIDEHHQSGTAYYETTRTAKRDKRFSVFARDFHHDIIEREERAKPFSILCSESHYKELEGVLSNHLNECASFKAALITTALFRKEKPNSQDVELPALFPLRTPYIMVNRGSNLKDVIHSMLEATDARLDQINTKETGWEICRIIFSQCEMMECAPASMGHGGRLKISHIPNWRSLVNMKNIVDEKCFLAALCGCLLYRKARRARVDPLNFNNRVYKSFIASLDTSNVTFPMTVESIERFLHQNKKQLNVVINIYTLYDGKVFPCALNIGSTIGSMEERKRKVVCSMLSVDVKVAKDSAFAASHLLAIRHLDGFLARRYANGSKYAPFHCPQCLDRFSFRSQRDHHAKMCIASPSVGQIERFSKPGSRMKWRDHSNQYLRPLIAAFDFEAILKPTNVPQRQQDGAMFSPCGGQCFKTLCKCADTEDSINRRIVSVHKDVVFAFVLADETGKVLEEHAEVVLDTDKSAASVFLDYLLKNEERWLKIANQNVPMTMTDADMEDFEHAKVCNHCKRTFSSVMRKPGVPEKVRDHNHYTGAYIGACCQNCNLNKMKKHRISLYAHNLYNYGKAFFVVVFNIMSLS